MNVGIINLGINNIKSIFNACKLFSNTYLINNSDDYLEKTSLVVVPGNGTFSEGMRKIKELKLDKIISQHIEKNKKLLGICLGLQLFMEKSQESPRCEGLGIIKGKVIKIKNKDFKTPLLGWYNTNFSETNYINNNFYYNNNYMIDPRDKSIIVGSINNFIPAFVKQNSIFGCQFHLEKSSKQGLRLLKKIISC
jgi:glutamine amidotransferase